MNRIKLYIYPYFQDNIKIIINNNQIINISLNENIKHYDVIHQIIDNIIKIKPDQIIVYYPERNEKKYSLTGARIVYTSLLGLSIFEQFDLRCERL